MTTYTVTCEPTFATQLHRSEQLNWYSSEVSGGDVTATFAETTAVTYVRETQRDKTIIQQSDTFSYINNNIGENQFISDARTAYGASTIKWNGEFSEGSIVADPFTTQSTRQTTTTNGYTTAVSVTTTTTSSVLSATVLNDLLTSASGAAVALSVVLSQFSSSSIVTTSEEYAETAYSYGRTTEGSTETTTGGATSETSSVETYTTGSGSNTGSATSQITYTSSSSFSGANITESSSEGFSNFPTYATATVVLLTYSEGAYSTVEFVADGYSAPVTEAFLAFESSAATISPLHWFSARQTTNAPIEEEQSVETQNIQVTTTATIAKTIGLFSETGVVPTPTRTQGATITTTTPAEFAIVQANYTGPVEPKTMYASTTFDVELGSLSWQQIHTATVETETLQNVAYVPSSEEESITGVGEGVTFTTYASLFRSYEEEASAPYAYSFNSPYFNNQIRGEGCFESAVGLVSADVFGRQLVAGSISAKLQMPRSDFWNVLSQSVYANPIVSWSAVDSGSSFTWSGNPSGLSQTVSTSNTDGQGASTSTSAPWGVVGPVPMVSELGTRHAINVGGRAADGNLITWFQMPGHYLTSNTSTSGFLEIGSAVSSELAASANRTAFSHRLIALPNGQSRYFTTSFITNILDPDEIRL